MTTAPQSASEHASFALEKRIAAAPARVFAAWSDAAKRDRWFVREKGWVLTEYAQDFRVGGREKGRFRQSEDSPLYENDSWFLDIVPDRRIVFAYAMDCDGARISASLSTVELKPDGEGTRVRYTEQAVFLDGRDKPAYRKEGWQDLLNKLEAEVLRG